jgi:threonylcarbamoyladenosine tRNA methylthiotransferase MtaB
MNKNFFVETLGCKLNQAESDSLVYAFVYAGFKLTSREQANIIILNSCAVTGKSEQTTRRLARCNAKTGALTRVTGCAASLSGSTLANLAHNIIVVPIKESLLELPAHLVGQSPDNYYTFTQNFIAHYSPSDGSTFNFKFDSGLHHSRPSLKIQDGCDRHCSYCATRLARGRSQSLASDEIVVRMQSLIQQGYHELVLTGVNLASYTDAKLGNLWGLVTHLINNSPANFRFRLSSLEPHFITNKTIELLKTGQLCPHFHLSIQSGSNAILNKMQRPYTAEDCEKAIKMLRHYNPYIFIAADIITGFPGESEADFEATHHLLKNNNINYVHAFAFSPRPQTLAANLTPKIPERTRDERLNIINNYAHQAIQHYNQQSIGQQVRVILEKERDNQMCRGRSEYYHNLWVSGVDNNYGPTSLIEAQITANGQATFIKTLN